MSLDQVLWNDCVCFIGNSVEEHFLVDLTFVLFVAEMSSGVTHVRPKFYDGYGGEGCERITLLSRRTTFQKYR